MTTARASYASLLCLAVETGCTGVEVRNDLDGDLFDGGDVVHAGKTANDLGLSLLALSEVSAFNDLSDRAYESVKSLAKVARACNAKAVSLIPRNDGIGTDKTERFESLRETVSKFAPVLEENNVLGYIEPLGFEQSSLRLKSEVVDVLEALDLTDRFKLVHDTFHHYLAGGEVVFPEHTGMVHISGVVENHIPIEQLRDDHRVLVDEDDVLDNLGQLGKLMDGGYRGPVSMEAFSPNVHGVKDPKTALLGSFDYLELNLVDANTKHTAMKQTNEARSRIS